MALLRRTKEGGGGERLRCCLADHCDSQAALILHRQAGGERRSRLRYSEAVQVENSRLRSFQLAALLPSDADASSKRRGQRLPSLPVRVAFARLGTSQSLGRDKLDAGVGTIFRGLADTSLAPIALKTIDRVSAMNTLSIKAVVLAVLFVGPAVAQSPVGAPPSNVYQAEETAAPKQAEPATAKDPYGDQPTSDAADRAALWNSPEMREAREYVAEYSRRSARTSPQQVERYLQQVSQLPSPQMQQWLRELQAKRIANERQQAVAESARQLGLDHAMQRIGQSQQAGFNAQQMKTAMAEYAQMQSDLQQAAAEEPPVDRKAELAAAIAAQRLVFDPFAPTLDPASPPARTRYAAAAVLPGDLPRGDPANFSRGDDRGGAAPSVPSAEGTAAGAAVDPSAGGSTGE
jgi:hypothetical protein